MSVNHRTVLVVDDSPEDRTVVRRFLQSDQNWETTVLEADKGALAIELCRATPPDCVLLDYQLPDMTGIDVLRAITVDEETPLCPVVMLTGSGTIDTALRALRQGAQDYLIKDHLSREELRRAVANAIEKTALRHAVAEKQEALERRNEELQQALQERDVELAERRRVQSLLAAQKRVLESAALDRPLLETLELLAREIETYLPGAMCSITLLEGDSLNRISGPSLPPEFRLEFDKVKMSAHAPLYAQAFGDGSVVITEDIATQSPWKEYNPASLRRVRTCWSAPFSAPSTDVRGIFSTYFGETRQPRPSDIATIEMAGRLVGLVVERARAMQALRDSEEFNRLILESNPDCVKVLDREGRLLSMNGPGLCVLEIEDFTLFEGQEWDTLWPEETRPIIKDSVEGALKGRTSQFRRFCPTAKGNPKWWDVIVGPVRDSRGQVVRVLATSRDVTQMREDEEDRENLLAREQEARSEAESASRAKDEFIATLSHELRTPLTAITGWSTLLRQGQLDDAMTARAYEVIERNANAQKQLIEDILDVSRIITGKMKLNSQPLQLAPVVQAAHDAVQLAAVNKGVELTLEMPDADATINGDAARLQQVFWNLLTNAVKFTPAGGAVRARVLCDAGWVVVEVQDSGQGIEAEFLPLVFERFQQADASTTRRHAGLGLGLAIVRYLTEAHGGNAGAHSDGPGHGATFTVRLPLLGATLSHDGEDAAHTPYTRLEGMDIVLVDDEPDVRELLALLLQQHGATVRIAANAPAALEMIVQQPPDAVISDIGMADRDGYQLLLDLRRHFGTLPFRILALTAYAGEKNRQMVLQSGFDTFLTKPIAPGSLIDALTS